LKPNYTTGMLLAKGALQLLFNAIGIGYNACSPSRNKHKKIIHRTGQTDWPAQEEWGQCPHGNWFRG